jgi:hypothetical protein
LPSKCEAFGSNANVSPHQKRELKNMVNKNNQIRVKMKEKLKKKLFP